MEKRKQGRPPKEGKTKALNIRLDTILAADLQTEANKQRIPLATLLRIIIEKSQQKEESP